jgi:SAM-dependent methyltransferase
MRPLVLLLLLATTAGAAQAQTSTAPAPYEPRVGQAGKDVVWVPTPPVLVEMMLDLAGVTASDVVMDLGSGDGRNIIAAAKRGARAIGVEYNADMVKLSQATAEREGVSDKATFVEGDMYAADISEATVLALFLLPSNLDRLLPKFLDLTPGTRIVINTFGMSGWEPDRVSRSESDCESWCTAQLWIVPAKVDGTWRASFGEVTFTQNFQQLTGTVTANGRTLDIEKGRLNGAHLTFVAGGTEYQGRVDGDSLRGTGWSATRVTR